eukprot:322213-Hanusia_phi.AAC.1
MELNSENHICASQPTQAWEYPSSPRLTVSGTWKVLHNLLTARVVIPSCRVTRGPSLTHDD